MPVTTQEAKQKAAARRVEQRAGRVEAGLEELDAWLLDQIRGGLIGLGGSGRVASGGAASGGMASGGAASGGLPGGVTWAAPGGAAAEESGAGMRGVELMAARMVDAQAPGLASRLRRLPQVLASGEGWHGRVLEEFALMRLLVRAHRQLAGLPAPLAAAVRAHVGYPLTRAQVSRRPAVRAIWSVLGLRDSIEERLIARRVWLQDDAGRPALVLSHAPPGMELDDSLLPGMTVDADVHFYPSGQRVVVGERHGDPTLLRRPVAVSVRQALTDYATALAADPWLGSWPMVLGEVTPVRDGERWLVRADDGTALPLARDAGRPWRLMATSGGHPLTVVGEWSAAGLLPLSAVRGQELVRV